MGTVLHVRMAHLFGEGGRCCKRQPRSVPSLDTTAHGSRSVLPSIVLSSPVFFVPRCRRAPLPAELHPDCWTHHRDARAAAHHPAGACGTRANQERSRRAFLTRNIDAFYALPF